MPKSVLDSKKRLIDSWWYNSEESEDESDEDSEEDPEDNPNSIDKNIDDDINRLIKFIKDLQIDMGFFVEQYQKIVPEHDDLHETFDLAWSETKPNFTDAIKYLHDKKPYSALSEVGLTKNQLNLKLKVFYLARKEFQTAKENFDYSEKAPKERRTLSKAINWLFEHGDTILGSLGSIGIPGTDAIKEFIDVGKILIQKLKGRKKAKNS